MGVPAVMAAVAVAPTLPTEAVLSLSSIVVKQKRPQLANGIHNKLSVALKLVIHLSATDTVKKPDGTRWCSTL